MLDIYLKLNQYEIKSLLSLKVPIKNVEEQSTLMLRPLELEKLQEAHFILKELSITLSKVLPAINTVSHY